MKAKRKITSVLLIAVMLCACLVAFAACGETGGAVVPEHKKAIIICTALISGGLYNTETGESAWDPLPEDLSFQQFMADGDMAGAIVSLLTDLNVYSTVLGLLNYETPEDQSNNFIYQVTLNEDGTSRSPLMPANTLPTSEDIGAYTGDSKIQYGALAAYRNMCLDLRARYGEDYDVVMFNYDWRIDNRTNSLRLEQFINTNGYEKVVLTSHSNGGPVVAGFLARSAENREKVEAYCAYSPAYSGSLDAVYFLDDPVGCCYDAVAGMGLDISGLGLFDEILNALAKPLIQNMTCVMQLLPSWDFLSSEYYDSDQSCIYIGDYPIRTKSELLEFYRSRPWAKMSNGQLKPAMSDLDEYWDSLYVNVGDERIFAPELVNTYYFLGTGYTTKKSVTFTASADNAKKADPAITFDHATGIKYGDGDGTMPINASLGGLAVDDIRDGHLIFYRHDHGSVGCDWAIMRDDMYEIVDGLLAA